MSDMRTPLGKVRGLGSAKDGTGNFWRLRVAAVALVPLSLFVVGWVLSLRGAGFAEVKASLSDPLIGLAVGLFVIVSLFHMRLGMKEIIEDYAHHEGYKLTLMILNTFFCMLIGAASVLALLKLSFGG